MERTVFFRALEPEDAPCIYKWRNDHKLMKDAIGMARPWSMKDCVKWLESKTTNDPFNYWFAICLNNESRQMIGYTGVNHIHFVNSSATCDAIVIAEKDGKNGFTWLDTNILIREFVFETLHLNRYYGKYSETQKITAIANELFYSTVEGIERQAIWKDGQYHDVYLVSLLREEYFMHKNNGDYEISALIKRLRSVYNQYKKR